jgi:hypothetical protein
VNTLRALVEQHRVAGLCVGAHRDLIRHGAGGHIHGVFHSQHSRDLGFQLLYRGVITIDVVAHRRARHRIAHRIGRLTAGIAAEIDYTCHLAILP